MQEIKKDQIDEIINNEQKSVNEKIIELYRVYNDNQLHPYILFRIAKYKYENCIKGTFKIFKKLAEIDDEEYKTASYYYLVKLALKAGNSKVAALYLNKLNGNEVETDNNNKEKLNETLNKQYSEILYKSGNIKGLLNHYNHLDALNKTTDVDHYYAFKGYLSKGDMTHAIKAIQKAIELNPSNVNYHKDMIDLYLQNKLYSQLLIQINKILSLDIDLEDREELKLQIPKITYKMYKIKDALEQVEQNISEGINNKDQDELYYKLLIRTADYYTADQVSKKIVGDSSTGLENYLNLARMNNRLNNCDKALNILDILDEARPMSYHFMYYRALTLIQMGEYNKASNIIYSVIDRYPNDFRFQTILALCFYLDGDKYASKEVLNRIPSCDGTKRDIFLRKELGLDYSSLKPEDDLYSSMINNYDFDKVYKTNRRRLCNNHSNGLKDGINIGGLISELNYLIKDLEPSYSMESDTYLIKYGEEIGLVNNKETQYLIAEALPNGLIYTIKPVIPTLDSKKNFQRTRFY